MLSLVWLTVTISGLPSPLKSPMTVRSGLVCTATVGVLAGLSVSIDVKKEKPLALVADWLSLLVTTMASAPQVPALAGRVQVIEVAETVGLGHVTPPTVTVAPVRNSVPVMVKEVEALLMDVFGATEVMVGGG
jgi:hypothetical protein